MSTDLLAERLVTVLERIEQRLAAHNDVGREIEHLSAAVDSLGRSISSLESVADLSLEALVDIKREVCGWSGGAYPPGGFDRVVKAIDNLNAAVHQATESKR